MIHSKRTKRESKFMQVIREYEDILIGMDVHKNKYLLAAYSLDYGHVATVNIPSGVEATIEFLQQARDSIVLVVYEAGPTGYSLYRRLKEEGFEAGVISPGSIPRKSANEIKTDRIDARKIAEYTANRMTRFVTVPEHADESVRQVTRGRKTASRKFASTKNRIKSFLLLHNLMEPTGLAHWSKASVNALREMELNDELRFVLDEMLEEFDFYKQQLARFDSRLRSMARRDAYKKYMELYKDISGVGLITAMVFMTEMFSPQRFNDRREATAYMGFAPRIIQSGEKQRNAGLSAAGNHRLRYILIQSAWRWIMKDPGAKQLYHKYYNRSNCSQKAIVAVARKLGIIMWRMYVTGEAYRGIA